MCAKYKLDKQTCQTIQQNVVQLNKSVLNRHRQLLLSFVLLLLSIGFGFLWLNFMTSWAVRKAPIVAQAAPTGISTALGSNSPVNVATKSATILVQSQPTAPLPVQLEHTVLIPTATPTTLVASPLPTVQASAPFTTTTALQNRVAISVAWAAQSLLAAIQEPVYAGAPVTITSSTPLTTPSGLLPPLPNDTRGALPMVSAVTAAITGTTATQSQTVDIALVNPSKPETALPLAANGEVRTAHVPILMYHYLSDAPPDADIYRRDLTVSPSLFAAQLDRIAAEGYTVIRLYDLIAYLTEGTPLPDKSVVLTFDDGYRDNYENALPLLREHGMTATFFIVMEFINRARPEYLTWPMVQEMAAAGMSIEAHGVDHTTLLGRSRVDLEFQALRSYETLQNEVGIRAHFISYPAGEFDEQTITVFQSAGYWAGFTTIQGATHRSDDLFRLPRVRIRSTTTPDELARLLALDW